MNVKRGSEDYEHMVDRQQSNSKLEEINIVVFGKASMWESVR